MRGLDWLVLAAAAIPAAAVPPPPASRHEQAAPLQADPQVVFNAPPAPAPDPDSAVGTHDVPQYPHDEPSTPERRREMNDLLEKYAPVFKLASTERYYPSSVKWMLDRYTYMAYKNGTTFVPDQSVFSLDGLGSVEHSKKLRMSVKEPHNPQPLIEDDSAAFLYGPAGQDDGMERGPDGRGRVHDEVYGFWVDQGRGVVDLWYWTYYPYNLGKEVGYLGWLGNHVSDWEHLRLRTINGTAVSADFDTHSGGPFSAGTYRFVDIEKWNGRPVAYVASGSHGVWPNAGKHVYAQLLNLWQLVDITDDYGAIWDTQGHVVPIEFWTGPDGAEKVKHTGDQSWLEFKGKWGNLGDAGCWWHAFVGICQLIEGPPGPNRKFGGPSDCIVGEAIEDQSWYSFYFSQNVSKQAMALNVTSVVVEQVCARPRAAAAAWSDDLGQDEIHTWAVSATLPFEGAVQYHAYIDPCGGSRSAAKAYRISLYDGDKKWISTSPIRVICLYTEGQEGWVTSAGARIDDVDEWRWWLVPDDGSKNKQRSILDRE